MSANSRWKFIRKRREEYLRQIDGDPTERQVKLITMAISAEWSAVEAEMTAQAVTGNARIEGLRLAAEYRRQLLLHDWHFHQTLPKPKPAPTAKGKFKD